MLRVFQVEYILPTPKFSISLPEDLVEAVSLRYPDSPFSTAIAKILRKGLESEPHPSSIVSGSSHIEITEMVRNIVIEELEKVNVIGDPDVDSEPIEIAFPIFVQDCEWLTSAQVGALLPDSLPRGTKNSEVCRAIASGDLETNGLDTRARRILRSSVLAWIESRTNSLEKGGD